MIPVGNGLLKRFNGVSEPSVVLTQGVVYAFTGSLLGLMLKATSFGIQKIPYPLRSTVLSLMRKARPTRGAGRLCRSMLFRLVLSGEFTRPNLPLRGSPAAAVIGLSALGIRTTMRSKRSDHGPICSKRNP